jgi:hypothetical protein
MFSCTDEVAIAEFLLDEFMECPEFNCNLSSEAVELNFPTIDLIGGNIETRSTSTIGLEITR